MRKFKKKGAAEVGDEILPEEEKGIKVKVEEAEEKAKVTEGAGMIRNVLKDLGVSEQELAEIDNLINRSGRQGKN